VTKKLIEIKRFFELAAKRKQIDENPLKYIDMPKGKKKKVRIYSEIECQEMLKAARDFISDRDEKTTIRWDLLIVVALQTGMRRGELLNLCWWDIDFDECNIDITAKEDTPDTWEWCIKDHELYHYYDQDSYSDSMERQISSFQDDGDLAFTCWGYLGCGQDIDDLGYILAFVAFNQGSTIVDTSNLNQSFRPFSAHCTSCNLYSEVITDCYVTLQQEGYLCIDEHQQVTFVRMKTEEYIEYASYQYSCCGKEISEDRLSQLRIDDLFRHSVEIVDMFADFWSPPVSGKVRDRFEILDL
jgi:hypothetical protein